LVKVIKKLGLTSQLFLLLILSLFLLNFTGSRLLKWTANQWLSDAEIHITDISLTSDSIFSQWQHYRATGYLEITQMSLKQAKNHIELSNIKLKINAAATYYLESIELDQGQIIIALDSLLADTTKLKSTTSGNTELSAVKAKWQKVITDIPSLQINQLDFRFNSAINNYKLPQLRIKNSSINAIENDSVAINIYLKENEDISRIEHHLLSLNLSLKESIELTSDKASSDIVTSDKATSDKVIGKLAIDISTVNVVAQSFIDRKIKASGLFSSEFTINSSQQGQALQFSSHHSIEQGQLDISGLQNAISMVAIDGDFITELTTDFLNIMELKLATEDKSTLKIITKLKTILSEQLKQLNLPNPINLYFHEYLSQALELQSKQGIVLDLINKELMGAFDLTAHIDSGRFNLSVSHLDTTADSTELDWQLFVKQTQPLTEIQSATLQASGDFYTNYNDAKLQVFSNTDLALTEITQLPEIKDSSVAVKAENIHAKAANFTLLKPITFSVKSGELESATVVEFTSSLSETSLGDLIINKLDGHHVIDIVNANNSNTANNILLNSSSKWQLNDNIEIKTTHKLTKALIKGDIEFIDEDLQNFSSWYVFPEQLTFDARIENSINYQFNFSSLALFASIQGEISQGSGYYNKTLFDEVSANWQCSWQEKGLNCKGTRLEIKEITAGAQLSQLMVLSDFYWQDKQWQLTLKSIKGELFEGTFLAENIDVLPESPIEGQISLSHISLNEVVKLQQQKGIAVNGYIDGTLPFQYKEGALVINNGKLINHQNGLIQIDGNPAIEQLKVTQPELKYALDALKELHFSLLSCELDMQADGETQLKMKIEGNNPTIERPIHFNYVHQENFIQLFRSLQIDTVLTEQLDKTIN